MTGYIDAPDGTRYYGKGNSDADISEEINQQIFDIYGDIPTTWVGKRAELVIEGTKS